MVMQLVVILQNSGPTCEGHLQSVMVVHHGSDSIKAEPIKLVLIHPPAGIGQQEPQRLPVACAKVLHHVSTTVGLLKHKICGKPICAGTWFANYLLQVPALTMNICDIRLFNTHTAIHTRVVLLSHVVERQRKREGRTVLVEAWTQLGCLIWWSLVQQSFVVVSYSQQRC